jgi:hypothetical protein
MVLWTPTTVGLGMRILCHEFFSKYYECMVNERATHIEL